jgi:hypothetical protein
MSKPMKPLIQDNSLPGKDSKPTPSKYKSRLLTLHHLLFSQLNVHTREVYFKKMYAHFDKKLVIPRDSLHDMDL